MANNTGVFFNINDNDGIPLVGVSTNGNVSLTPFYGNTGIGTTNPTEKLDVVGNINTTGIITASSFVGTTEVPFIQKGGRDLTLNSETTFAPLFVGGGFLPTPITISLSSGTYEISFLIKVTRGTIETPSASLIMRLLNTAGLGLTPPYGYISGKISGKSPGSTSFDNLITSSNIESEIVLTNSASIPGEYIAHFSGIMHILQNNFIIGPQYRFSNITNTGATCASSNYMSIKKISNTELSNSYQGGWTI